MYGLLNSTSKVNKFDKLSVFADFQFLKNLLIRSEKIILFGDNASRYSIESNSIRLLKQ